MKAIGNVIWLVFGGLVLAVEYFLVGVVLCVTVIGIPFGIQCFKLAGFSLWPFGWTMERRPDAGGMSALGNVLWFLLAGWWICLTNLIAGAVMCLTVVGIPVGLGAFKLAGVALAPFGRERVPTDRPTPA